MSEQQPVDQATKIKTNNTGSGWALGLVVVFIGALLLVRNLGIKLALFQLDNWWAIFILCAAIAPLFRAIKCFTKTGWSLDVANALVSTLAIVALGLLILLDLSLMVWWPLFLIIGGLYMMTNRSQ